jgi:hypothetical protein
MVQPRYRRHAREQMIERNVSEAEVEFVLEQYHTSQPAPQRPFEPISATIYVATIHGRGDLKVYVQDGTDPPLVRTVAWRG